MSPMLLTSDSLVHPPLVVNTANLIMAHTMPGVHIGLVGCDTEESSLK